MKDETLEKALELRAMIKSLKESPELAPAYLGEGDPVYHRQMVVLAFVDMQAYNRARAETIEHLEKELAEL